LNVSVPNDPRTFNIQYIRFKHCYSFHKLVRLQVLYPFLCTFFFYPCACLQPMNHHGVLLQFYHEGMLIGLRPTPCSHGLVIQLQSSFISRSLIIGLRWVASLLLCFLIKKLIMNLEYNVYWMILFFKNIDMIKYWMTTYWIDHS